jgi:hypothetical protein
MKITKILLVVLFAGSLFVPVQPVHADMAPPPAPGLGGLRPFQYQATEVQMIYERVEMTLNPLPDSGDAIVEEKVDVSAWFVLHNTGTKDEEMRAAFPLDSLNFCGQNENAPSSMGVGSSFVVPSTFKVASDGKELQTQITEIEGIECVSWATFDIKFPANKDILVKVDYSMQTQGVGHDLILEYILETGSGWKGPIKQAYIVFRFPYLVTSGNVNSKQTTSGYQSLYNEIFWSYRDIEPTPEDNIIVSFFEPNAWMKIKASENQVELNPMDLDTWLNLFDEYAIGAPYNTKNIGEDFERAIKFNPDNADLYAKYADFLLPNCCYYLSKGGTTLPTGAWEYAQRHVVPLINQSLALDPTNKTALGVLETLRYVFPDFVYTAPPTIPPTATSPFTATPSITPTMTVTPIPSETPFVVTVVHTKLVKAPTATKDLDPAITIYPSLTLQPDVPQSEGNSSSLLFGALLVFAVGAGSGWLLSKRQKK